jgi:hypothetical protein
VKDERVNVRPKFGDYKRDAMGHQAADEVNVAAKSI